MIQPSEICDAHGRAARYLRVSLTPACNYRCGFCMPAERGDGLVGERLDCGDLLRLCGVFASLGIHRFKITGGEPFMEPAALPFLAALAKDVRVGSLTVTTNGSTLGLHARALAGIGVDGVNVSVNAMTQGGYERVTGTGVPLAGILENIAHAKQTGLRVKLNMVPIRGLNDGDILPLLDFALPRGIPVRFIELMPIGLGRCHGGVPFDEIRARIEQRFGKTSPAPERLGNGPAEYLAVPGHTARVGCIAAVSKRFCASCDRLRLNSAGVLRTCLHHDHGADLSVPLREGKSDGEIAALIRRTVLEKPEGHRFGAHERGASLCPDPMYRIGG